MADELELKPIREVSQKSGWCCGEPSRKLLVGLATGKPRTRYACEKCKKQYDGPELTPGKQTT